MMANLMLVYFVLLYLQEGLQAEHESYFLEDFVRSGIGSPTPGPRVDCVIQAWGEGYHPFPHYK